MESSFARQIVNNPFDLQIVIAQTKVKSLHATWYFTISLCTEDGCKLLFSSNHPEDLLFYREDALSLLEVGIFYLALVNVRFPQQIIRRDLNNETNDFNSKRKELRDILEGSPALPNGFLSLELIDKIMASLADRNELHTSSLEPNKRKSVKKSVLKFQE